MHLAEHGGAINTRVQSVLAATDLSRPAFAAVRRAALIARAHSASLELVYVIPESFSAAAWHELRAMFSSVEKDLRTAVMANISALVDQLEQECGLKAQAVVLDGKPAVEIAARARVIGADLIVVGAHGEHAGLTLLGTTAQRLLRGAFTPVLLVKPTPPLELAPSPGYARIIVATDLSEQSAHAAECAHRLFPQANMSLFHAVEAPVQATLFGGNEDVLAKYRQRAIVHAERALESFAGAANLRLAQRVVRDGPAGARVRAYAVEVGAELIALGVSGTHSVGITLLGSVATDVLTHAQCDVLLARTVG